MIWLNSYGGVYPFGSQTATASIAGMNWNIWTGQQSGWKIISYILNPVGTSFRTSTFWPSSRTRSVAARSIRLII
jgi:hypothetical protein